MGKKRPRAKKVNSDDEDDNEAKKTKGKIVEKTNSKRTSALDSLPPPIFSKWEIIKNFWKGEPGQDPVSDELKITRKNLGILAKGNLAVCPPPILTINGPEIPEEFTKILSSMGVVKPSPIQMQAWPAILSGGNILGIAPAGSGKTLAYGLPLIPHVLEQMKNHYHNRSPVAVVLVPVRELTQQIASALLPLRRFCHIRTVAVHGGQNKEEQVEALDAGAQIVIATPGRLIDLLSSKSINLDSTTYLVLDEADRMLSIGFEPQIDMICGRIRPDRQTLLFSATFPGSLREAANRWVKDAVIIRANSFNMQPYVSHGIGDDVGLDPVKEVDVGVRDDQVGTNAIPESEKKLTATDSSGAAHHAEAEAVGCVQDMRDLVSGQDEEAGEGTEGDRVDHSSYLTISHGIRQTVHICASHKKPRLLLRHIESLRLRERESGARQMGALLIFCAKIKTLKYVCDFLKKNDVVVEALHGQMNQLQREKTLRDFKAGKVHTVCATDVAARGIHIKRLRFVVNYDFPSSLEQYCHRVGRAGRQYQHDTPDMTRSPNAGGDIVGEAYSLLTRNMAPLSGDLVQLLMRCNQVVEPNLLQLVNDYKSGGLDLDPGKHDESHGDT